MNTIYKKKWADEFSTDAFGEMLSKYCKYRSSTKIKCFATPTPFPSQLILSFF